MSEAGTGRVALALVNLDIGGRHVQVEVPVPSGPSRLQDLLPSATALTEGAAALTVEQARSEGREISCRAGCGACCRQLVMISVVEAQALAELVASFPPERQQAVRRRFAEALRRLEAGDILDSSQQRGSRTLVGRDVGSMQAIIADLSRRYFELAVACPFLEEEMCSIHPQRPQVCRGYHVTSPAENCAHVYDAQIDRIEPPFRMSDILGELAGQACEVVPKIVPLVLSLEWSEANGGRVQGTADGRDLFGALMRQMAASQRSR